MIFICREQILICHSISVAEMKEHLIRCDKAMLAKTVIFTVTLHI